MGIKGVGIARVRSTRAWIIRLGGALASNLHAVAARAPEWASQSWWATNAAKDGGCRAISDWYRKLGG